jgi:hypothetical protein
MRAAAGGKERADTAHSGSLSYGFVQFDARKSDAALQKERYNRPTKMSMISKGDCQ